MTKLIALQKWDASIYKRHFNLAPASILQVKGEVTTNPFKTTSLE